MSKVFIEESTLTAIGDAIREKTGGTELIPPLDMADEISGIVSGGGDLPDEAFVITGNGQFRFAYNGWNWFIEKYGNKITTKDIIQANSMFAQSTELNSIPFELNFIDGSLSIARMFEECRKIETIPSIDFKQTVAYQNCGYLFASCNNLKEIGTLKNLYPSEMGNLFLYCYNLRELPKFENLNLNRIHTYGSCSLSTMFANCYSLRNIQEDFLKQLYQPLTTGYFYSVLNNAFAHCYSLDEIRGLNPQTGTMTSNLFNSSFNNCSRLKNIVFALQDDNTPYSVNWKNQKIDLSVYVGYIRTSYEMYILDYNSGITADKEVKDDATYQALKNDADWFTKDIAYSRYNHDSAVNTINSLPDTSAYLATAGGTNTIIFEGAAGEKTDGGAISNLTAEEIAIATAKGWTVTFK